MKNEEIQKMDRLLSLSEVATYFGVNERTVRRLVSRGELISVKFGACRRILYSEARRFIERHVQGAAKASPG